MNRTTTPFALLVLCTFLGLGQAACGAGQDDAAYPTQGNLPVGWARNGEDVPLPPVGVSPGVAPGETTGCTNEELPAGKLRGRVYDIPMGTKLLPDFDTLPPVEMVCLDRLAVTTRRSVYPAFPGLNDRFRWFAVDLEGTFLVDEPGLFYFRLTSDDGSKFLIDDQLVIDNDGYHPTRVATGVARLAGGSHRIRVPYWQGPGPLALILEVARPGEQYQIFRMDQPLRGSG
jgi:PA14 domain